MMSRFLLIVFLAMPLAQGSQAQQGREGSLYSRFGLGELQPFYASKTQALGGQALGYSSSTFVNLANPASLSDQLLTRLSAGVLFQGVEATDAAGAQSRVSANNFDGLTVGIPLLTGKLGVALGFSQLSRLGYELAVTRPLDLGDELDAPNLYSASFEGRGGLGRISFGAGYRFSRMLSVGLRGDMVFGILEDVQETRFADARFDDTRVVRSTRLRGYRLGVGSRFSFPSVIREGDFLNIGASVDLPTSLDATRIRTEGLQESPDTLGGRVKGTADLPVSLGLGILYQPSAKLSWNVDYRYEPWSSFESTFAFPGYQPGSGNQLKDRTRISSGIEYFPAGRDLLASYLARTAYRFGVFHESGYVSPDPNKSVGTTGLTGGLSLPTLGGGTRIDINVEVGTRGSASANMVRDRYLRIGVHFNFAERWFTRRQLG